MYKRVSTWSGVSILAKCLVKNGDQSSSRLLVSHSIQSSTTVISHDKAHHNVLAPMCDNSTPWSHNAEMGDRAGQCLADPSLESLAGYGPLVQNWATRSSSVMTIHRSWGQKALENLQITCRAGTMSDLQSHVGKTQDHTLYILSTFTTWISAQEGIGARPADGGQREKPWPQLPCPETGWHIVSVLAKGVRKRCPPVAKWSRALPQ